ncbi:MAG TPA: hypothetical protein VJH92_00265 [Candidatus Nanoarchaeia archaeon]|nr:hypothetical protein [Candidatus Nanoarchaeia archaeon]
MEQNKSIDKGNDREVGGQNSQHKDHNKIFAKVGIFLGVLVLFFVAWMVVSHLQAQFEYRGVKFEKVKEIAPYRTSIPLTSGSGITGNAVQKIDYSFYMRNDPRKLEKVLFEGEINFKKIMVVKSKEEFKCEGYGVIGIANLVQLYQAIGIKVIKDETAECGNDRSYMLLEIVSGNETKIEQTAEGCYTMSIRNCEILPATERFMVETFVAINNKIEGN